MSGTLREALSAAFDSSSSEEDTIAQDAGAAGTESSELTDTTTDADADLGQDDPAQTSGDDQGQTRGDVESDDGEQAKGEPEQSQDAKARDEKGRFAKGDGKAQQAKPEEKAKPAVKPQASQKADPKVKAGDPAQAAQRPAESTQKPPIQAAAQEFKPPKGWGPAAREHWAKLPAEVQKEVARREREVAQVFEQSAGARRVAQEFVRTIRPFEGMIQSEGSDPITAVTSMLRTAYALRHSPPGHKAQLVASMIKEFGVPVDALDAALAGQNGGAPAAQQQPAQAPAYAPQSQPREFRDRRLDALLEQQARTLRQQTTSQIEKFAETHEFFDDVRAEMADFIELGAKRGIVVSDEDAYNRAIALHPDIQQVIQQREAVKAAATAQAATQRARAAASSVKPSPAQVSTSTSGPKDLRGTLSAAYDKASAGDRL